MAQTIINDPGCHVLTDKMLSSGLRNFPGDRVIQMSSGEAFSAILCETGRVYTFGDNDHGQLGLRPRAGVTTIMPTLVDSLATTFVRQMACGVAFTLFLTRFGEVFACGSNHYGQLGLGDKKDRSLPARVSGIPPITMLAAGGHHSILVASTGEVYAAGSNEYGQLGTGSTDNKTRFTVVSSIRASVRAIVAGRLHSAIIVNQGTLYTCGRNYYGQLGYGNNLDSKTFQTVSLPSAATAVACGWDHTVALTSDGAVWSWGLNDHGQLGHGTNHRTSIPQRVVGIERFRFTKIVAGYMNTGLITTTGNLLMCGVGRAVLLGEAGKPINFASTVLTSQRLVVDQVSFSKTHALVLAVPNTTSNIQQNPRTASNIRTKLAY